MAWSIMLEVRLIHGELMAWWLTRPDEPVATLKGRGLGLKTPAPKQLRDHRRGSWRNDLDERQAEGAGMVLDKAEA